MLKRSEPNVKSGYDTQFSFLNIVLYLHFIIRIWNVAQETVEGNLLHVPAFV